MKRILKIAWIAAMLSPLACTHHAVPVTATPSGHSSTALVPSAPCIVYKTNGDYSKLVPVILSEDGTRIVSYPDRLDISLQGTSVYPTQLANGYLLDNRGISPYVAFLKTTYSEYGSGDDMPTSTQLMDQIFVKDPVVEMYQCGKRSDYSDLAGELNRIIQSGHLTDCIRLK